MPVPAPQQQAPSWGLQQAPARVQLRPAPHVQHVHGTCNGLVCQAARWLMLKGLGYPGPAQLVRPMAVYMQASVMQYVAARRNLLIC